MHDLLERPGPRGRRRRRVGGGALPALGAPSGRAARVLAVAAAIALVAGDAVLATLGGSGDHAGPSAPAPTSPSNVVRDDVHGVELMVPAGRRRRPRTPSPATSVRPGPTVGGAALGTSAHAERAGSQVCAHAGRRAQPARSDRRRAGVGLLADRLPWRRAAAGAVHPHRRRATTCVRLHRVHRPPADFFATYASCLVRRLFLPASVYVELEDSAVQAGPGAGSLDSSSLSPVATRRSAS